MKKDHVRSILLSFLVLCLMRWSYVTSSSIDLAQIMEELAPDTPNFNDGSRSEFERFRRSQIPKNIDLNEDASDGSGSEGSAASEVDVGSGNDNDNNDQSVRKRSFVASARNLSAKTNSSQSNHKLEASQFGNENNSEANPTNPVDAVMNSASGTMHDSANDTEKSGENAEKLSKDQSKSKEAKSEQLKDSDKEKSNSTILPKAKDNAHENQTNSKRSKEQDNKLSSSASSLKHSEKNKTNESNIESTGKTNLNSNSKQKLSSNSKKRTESSHLSENKNHQEPLVKPVNMSSQLSSAERNAMKPSEHGPHHGFQLNETSNATSSSYQNNTEEDKESKSGEQVNSTAKSDVVMFAEKQLANKTYTNMTTKHPDITIRVANKLSSSSNNTVNETKTNGDQNNVHQNSTNSTANVGTKREGIRERPVSTFEESKPVPTAQELVEDMELAESLGSASGSGSGSGSGGDNGGFNKKSNINSDITANEASFLSTIKYLSNEAGSASGELPDFTSSLEITSASGSGKLSDEITASGLSPNEDTDKKYKNNSKDNVKMSQKASSIVSSKAKISQASAKQAPHNNNVSKSLNKTAQPPKAISMTPAVSTKPQKQPSVDNNKQSALSNVSLQKNLKPPAHKAKRPADHAVKVSPGVVNTQHVSQTVPNKQSPLSLQPKQHGSPVVQKESSHAIQSQNQSNTFQNLSLTDQSKNKSDTVKHQGKTGELGDKHQAETGELGDSHDEIHSKTITNKHTEGKVSNQKKTKDERKAMETAISEDLSGEGADLLKSTSKIEPKEDDENLPGSTGDDMTDEDLQKLQSISLNTTADSTASNENDFGDDLMSSLSPKPSDKLTKKSEIGSTSSIPKKEDGESANDKKTVAQDKSTNDKKTVPDEKSANDTKNVALDKSANDKKTVADDKSESHKKTMVDDKSAKGNKTVADAKSANDKKAVPDDKSANDKKTVADDKSANLKKTVADDKSGNDTKTVTDDKSANDKKNVTNNKSESHKKTMVDDKSAKDNKTLPDVKSANDKKAVPDDKSANDKKTVADDKSINDKKTDDKSATHKKTVEVDKSGNDKKKVTDDKLVNDTKTVADDKSTNDTKTVPDDKAANEKKTVPDDKSANDKETVADDKSANNTKPEADDKSISDKKTVVPSSAKEASKAINRSEFSFDKIRKSTLLEQSKPLKAWTMIFNGTDENNLPGGYGDDYLEEGSGGSKQSESGSGRSKEDIEIQVESSIGSSYETTMADSRKLFKDQESGSGSGEDYSGNEILPGDYGSETPLNLEEEGTGSGGEDGSGFDFMSGTSGSGSGLDSNIDEYLKVQAGYSFSKPKPTESKGVSPTESKGVSTTESKGVSTTESVGVSTTESKGVSTTESVGVTTPESKVVTTTQNSAPTLNKQTTLSGKAQSETISSPQSNKGLYVPVSTPTNIKQTTVQPTQRQGKTTISNQEPIKRPEIQPQLEAKQEESETQPKLESKQEESGTQPKSEIKQEESSGISADTSSGSGGESGSGEKFDVNLQPQKPHEEEEHELSEVSASGSGFLVSHVSGSKDFYPQNIALNPAVGSGQFVSQQAPLNPLLQPVSIPTVNAIPRQFHSNLTVQVNQMPSVWAGNKIEGGVSDYTASVSASGDEEEQSASGSGDEGKQVKEIVKDQTETKEDKTVSEEEENARQQTTKRPKAHAQTTDKHAQASGEEENTRQPTTDHYEEKGSTEKTKTKEESYEETELPHQREIIKTPIDGTKKHHKPVIKQAEKHEQLMPEDDDDEEEDQKPKYEGFTDSNIWPQEGDIVTEEFLEHLMVSQLLEQNLKLFYTNMAGRPGPSGDAGDKGISGIQGVPGQNGMTGVPGEPGSIGPIGTIGIKGPQGTTGWPGLKGEMGGAGEPGLQGPKGSPGPPGPSGDPGKLGDEAILPNCSYVCEGEKAWLQCKQYEAIKILRVFWGREDDQICTKAPRGLTIDKTCESDSDNAFKKINSQCKFQQGCEIVASNIFFDDNTCGDVFKYLKICYECTPDEANAVDVLLEKKRKRKRRRRRKRQGEKYLEPTRRKRSLLENAKKISLSNNVHIPKQLWNHPFHSVD